MNWKVGAKREDVTETALELAETFIQLGANVNAEDKEGNLSNFINTLI
jgi:hypothetical protein